MRKWWEAATAHRLPAWDPLPSPAQYTCTRSAVVSSVSLLSKPKGGVLNPGSGGGVERPCHVNPPLTGGERGGGVRRQFECDPPPWACPPCPLLATPPCTPQQHSPCPPRPPPWHPPAKTPSHTMSCAMVKRGARRGVKGGIPKNVHFRP
jgi:hypothetical protein